MRILLVEDNEPKGAEITRCIDSLQSMPIDPLDVARDLISARRFLKTRHYDVLLLDLLIPNRTGEVPAQDGGARLVEELLAAKSALIRPRFIVGITAYDDVADKHASLFASHLFGLVKYEQSSTAWRSALSNLLGHAHAASDASRPQADLLLVCALEDPELKTVLSNDLQWRELRDDNDSSIYHRGELSKGEAVREIIAVACPGMGMPMAAATAMKSICRFSPRYVAMCGIAAGMKARTSIGEVIVADPSWDYGSGKFKTGDEGEIKFLIEPSQIALDPLTKTQLKRVAADSAFLAGVRDRWMAARPNLALQVKFGPMASGAAVLAAQQLTEQIERQHRKVLAVDMETYGVFVSGMYARYPRPKWLCAKGICDFADANKGDDWQSYAAYTSAAFIIEWARRYL